MASSSDLSGCLDVSYWSTECHAAYFTVCRLETGCDDSDEDLVEARRELISAKINVIATIPAARELALIRWKGRQTAGLISK